MSSFKGLNLFGSGPHRFAQDRQGQVTLSLLAQGSSAPGTTPLGLTELDVIVTGRLTAATEAALWALRDAITAQLIHPPTAGTLIDSHGRTWTDMSFIEFSETDRTDRARVRSIEYTARFRRFLTPP